jgi:hypothetical protein
VVSHALFFRGIQSGPSSNSLGRVVGKGGNPRRYSSRLKRKGWSPYSHEIDLDHNNPQKETTENHENAMGGRLRETEREDDPGKSNSFPIPLMA